MYNWSDLGLIIKPVLDNTDSKLFPDTRQDRPHILKCPITGKYVCWIHLAGKDACFMILQSDSFTGPYEIVREAYRPGGYEVGDFDLIRDEETDKAYLFFDGNHSGVYGMILSDDYLAAEKLISKQYEGLTPPFCREGIAVTSRNGKKYMFSSGMTGYIPNKSDYAQANTWEDTFISRGNPYPGDKNNSSFNSQFTQIFKVPGKKDLYIAMSDRWVPDYPVNAKLADIIMRAIASRYQPEKYSISDEEMQIYRESPQLYTTDTSVSDYVWLPVSFSDDRTEIYWRDNWSLDEFE